mmetsp:Transcript_32454/g.47676  ORF Transcript_32454/g.47676 Transcript_32454/m.47676 type:complete len:540 (+) Transcript_32454:163-1782(+)|eukprot:CAMPEP_0195524710 /NCGR_PEP_ID=MMETSP0794_2-20130614/24709_1 /TAXON_ID=515487 /ORGANISM="Stephanopyxis turris, Strain CCMP 815" /LENGTH=539 /DNA_ID=CAMNT_0040654987 /DNA_START=152 /DNA_END=1771 /DNA_ORIENTATION=-
MSISTTSGVPTLAGGYITLSNIKQPTDLESRRTKIVCTLGPACWEVPQLETLIDAGMNVARFNFSHGDHEGHLACLNRLREAANNRKQNVAVMLDTKGPEIRTGFFADDAKKINLIKGETIILTTDYSFKGSKDKLACSYEKLATSVKPGQSILIADGSLVVEVIECNVEAGEVSCRIKNNASIGERKNMNLPGVTVDLPTLTEKDVDDIQNFGIKHGVDFIAASFVRKGSDVTRIREVLGDKGQGIKVISKIENLEGLQNFDSILRATDAVMVARGDLGMEIPPEKVFLAQKLMIRECNIAGKPVITATQMLESMIQNPRPTRAECSDVANAVLDGTDCVMLSGETANGSHFEEAVKFMAGTCCEAEATENFNLLYQSVRNSCLGRYGTMSTAESIASSAVKTAIDVKAKLIVVFSETGATARQIAKFRPGMPVCVLTPSERIARQTFGILKGSYAFVVDSLENTDALVQETTDEVKKAGVCKDGDPYVLVCGNTFGMGATNQVKVEFVRTNYWDEPGEHQSSAKRVGEDNPKGCTIS